MFMRKYGKNTIKPASTTDIGNAGNPLSCLLLCGGYDETEGALLYYHYRNLNPHPWCYPAIEMWLVL